MTETVKFTWLTGSVCIRCMETIPRGGDEISHLLKRCTLKPATYVVVPQDRDKPEAIQNAMLYGRHSRADAEVIVKTEAEMEAIRCAS